MESAADEEAPAKDEIAEEDESEAEDATELEETPRPDDVNDPEADVETEDEVGAVAEGVPGDVTGIEDVRGPEDTAALLGVREFAEVGELTKVDRPLELCKTLGVVGLDEIAVLGACELGLELVS